ncbi:hypothetical protein NDU88_002225 [Pleurodeles waltl]|uniref:Uncharacterized protein n=1 Tax=Pleurodeles waltl TaxID=8319 RepID=A0AAV7MN56_PLEWA|nr:hypothetical protein NDU88_002225 [Pleurodeles waltl]
MVRLLHHSKQQLHERDVPEVAVIGSSTAQPNIEKASDEERFRFDEFTRPVRKLDSVGCDPSWNPVGPDSAPRGLRQTDRGRSTGREARRAWGTALDYPVPIQPPNTRSRSGSDPERNIARTGGDPIRCLQEERSARWQIPSRVPLSNRRKRLTCDPHRPERANRQATDIPGLIGEPEWAG